MLRNNIRKNLSDKSVTRLGSDVLLSYEDIHEIANTPDLSNVPLGKIVTVADALEVGITDLYDEIFYRVYLTVDTEKEDYRVEEEKLFKSYNYDDCIRFIIDDYYPEKYENILDYCDKLEVIYSIIGFVRNDVDIWEVDEETEIVKYTADVKYVIGLKRKIEGYRELIDRVNSMSENAEEAYQDRLYFDYDMFLRISNDVEYEHIDLVSLGDIDKYREECKKMIDDFCTNIEKLKCLYSEHRALVK